MSNTRVLKVPGCGLEITITEFPDHILLQETRDGRVTAKDDSLIRSWVCETMESYSGDPRPQILISCGKITLRCTRFISKKESSRLLRRYVDLTT